MPLDWYIGFRRGHPLTDEKAPHLLHPYATHLTKYRCRSVMKVSQPIHKAINSKSKEILGRITQTVTRLVYQNCSGGKRRRTNGGNIISRWNGWRGRGTIRQDITPASFAREVDPPNSLQASNSPSIPIIELLGVSPPPSLWRILRRETWLLKGSKSYLYIGEDYFITHRGKGEFNQITCPSSCS